jgi:hypothetical protein
MNWEYNFRKINTHLELKFKFTIFHIQKKKYQLLHDNVNDCSIIRSIFNHFLSYLFDTIDSFLKHLNYWWEKIYTKLIFNIM